tara:strand:- start:45850 stop:46041 length:192 start_codon:yes stop_codon:yes gene_type:complete
MNTHRHRGQEEGFSKATIASCGTAPMNKMLRWKWEGAREESEKKQEMRESEKELVEQFTGVAK